MPRKNGKRTVLKRKAAANIGIANSGLDIAAISSDNSAALQFRA